MVHLLHRLYGVDAPVAVLTVQFSIYSTDHILQDQANARVKVNEKRGKENYRRYIKHFNNIVLSEDWKVLPVSNVSLSSEIAGKMERFRK